MQQAEQFTHYMAFLQDHPATGLLVVAWLFSWKGIALWKAAQREDKWWFIVLLVLQTFGVAEMIYIFWFARNLEDEESAL